jgi:hypothetical protein
MERRTFLQTLASGAAATWLSDKAQIAQAATRWFPMQMTPTLAEVKSGFLNPPPAAQPWVYWFVSDGNITKEGITADLEAMHRVGIRGVLYMEVDQNCPPGPVRFMSPEWREMIKFAVTEATRLGMTIDMNDCAGWCASAGPWITPELSMQMVDGDPCEGRRALVGTASPAAYQPGLLSRHCRIGFSHARRSQGSHGRFFPGDNLRPGSCQAC